MNRGVRVLRCHPTAVFNFSKPACCQFSQRQSAVVDVRGELLMWLYSWCWHEELT